jgi:hypothetical protein
MKFELGFIHDLSSTVRTLISRLTNDLTCNIHSYLQQVFNSTQNLELKFRLSNLINQLPDLQSDTSDTYDWWHDNGQSWTEKLRFVMFKYCHIGREWQLTPRQKELLNQYYDANKLLVDSLNSTCVVSDTVRDEFEDTLLLPIAEIKKRQRQRQVMDIADE